MGYWFWTFFIQSNAIEKNASEWSTAGPEEVIAFGWFTIAFCWLTIKGAGSVVLKLLKKYSLKIQAFTNIFQNSTMLP